MSNERIFSVLLMVNVLAFNYIAIDAMDFFGPFLGLPIKLLVIVSVIFFVLKINRISNEEEKLSSSW